MVRLDLPYGPIELDRELIVRLRDAAAAMAGRSSAARDLAYLLGRALDNGSAVALRRGETLTLREVAQAAGLPEVADRLSGPSAR